MKVSGWLTHKIIQKWQTRLPVKPTPLLGYGQGGHPVEWRDGHLDLQGVPVGPDEEAAAPLQVVELVEAEQVVKVDDLVVGAEDVVGGPHVPDVGEALLLAQHDDADLYPPLRLVLGGDAHPDGPEHLFRHLLHLAGGENLEALLEPDALRVEVDHPLGLAVAAVVGRGLLRAVEEGAGVVDGQLGKVVDAEAGAKLVHRVQPEKREEKINVMDG